MLQYIRLEEGELEFLLRNLPCRTPVDVSFGTGGCALTYDDEKPLPADVELLLKKRGVLNQNCEGAGI